MRAPRIVAVAAMLLLAGTARLAAQQPAPSSSVPAAPERPDLGIGFQSSWPAYGISGIYDLSDRTSAQGVIGFLGGWTTLSARGLYRFSERPYIDPYGYGMVGMWRYDSGFADASAVSFGAGGGIDFDLRRVGPDLPPLFLNMEFGISVVDLDLAGYTGAWMAFGAGIHYRL